MHPNTAGDLAPAGVLLMMTAMFWNPPDLRNLLNAFARTTDNDKSLDVQSDLKTGVRELHRAYNHAVHLSELQLNVLVGVALLVQ
jgi:hypothetical protein